MVTFALGLAAALTTFSVVAALDLRTLPFRQADRLVALRHGNPCADDGSCPASAATSTPHFTAWQEAARSYERMAAVAPYFFSFVHRDEVESVTALATTPGLFAVLGVRPALGRGIEPNDLLPGAEPVVVLGDSLWRANFGGDSAVVGRRIALDPDADGHAARATVIGVMPRGFHFWNEAAWVPAGPDVQGDGWSYLAIGRLRPGVTVAQATAELRVLSGRSGTHDGATAPGVTAWVAPLRETYVDAYGIGDRRFLLLGIAAAVLGIAGVNVAALTLTRVIARRGEFAVLGTLGAPWWRLRRQVVLESVLPTLVSGVAGLLVAAWGMEVQARYRGLHDVGLSLAVDATVLGFGLLLALAVGAGVGFAAARIGIPTDAHLSLRAGMASRTVSAWPGRLSDGFVIAQVMAAFVLGAGGLLLATELRRLQHDEPGFDPRNLYMVNARTPDRAARDQDARRTFGAEVRARVAAVPGVVGASLGPTDFRRGEIRLAGASEPVRRADRPLGMSIDETYFALVGTPVRRGRAFDRADGAGAAAVAIVNETAAQQLWPGRDAVGQRMFFGSRQNDSARGALAGSWATVVGVVANAKAVNATLRKPAPIVYRPFAQAPVGVRVFVRVTGDSARVLAQLRIVLREVTGRPTNRQLDIGSATENMVSQLSDHRFTTRSLVALASFGLLLASVGLAATIAGTVQRRRREIGIRMALGATRRSVLYLVTRRSLALVSIGLAVGTGAAFALTRVLRSMLVGTSVTDPRAFLGAAACVVLAAAAASYLPGRRALAIEPADALRAPGGS